MAGAPFLPPVTDLGNGEQLITMTHDDAEAMAGVMIDAEPWRSYRYDRAMVRDFLVGSLEAGLARVVRGAATGDEPIAAVVVHPGFLGGRFLEILAIREDRRGRGLGRRIVEAVCLEMPVQMRDLFVLAAGTNEPAQAFYRRLGFREAGELPGLIRPDKTERLLWLRFR